MGAKIKEAAAPPSPQRSSKKAAVTSLVGSEPASAGSNWLFAWTVARRGVCLPARLSTQPDTKRHFHPHCQFMNARAGTARVEESRTVSVPPEKH